MSREIRKYTVFKKSHRLALDIYTVTKSFPAEEKFGLISQMRRSAYSIPMNLLEGGMRDSEAEFRHFVNIARGSCAELLYQIEFSRDLGYINTEKFIQLSTPCDEIGKMLTRLFQKLKAKS